MILLVPLEYPAASELETLGRRLAAEFGAPVELSPPLLRGGAFFDAKRSQYYSSAILKALVGARPPEAERVLAVTRLDLFIPILTFVFGEAQLGGPCAVVSSFRLDNRFYGLPDDPAQLHERLYKEAVHELGHTYGLVHCRNPECVMRQSTYMEEIDVKSGAFCPACKSRL